MRERPQKTGYGSTDTTEDIIKSYKDKRIKYFKNKNQGIGKTRNFGIDKATAKYIMFLDSDDYLDKRACEVMFQKAEAYDLDVVICDFYREYDNGTVVEVKHPYFENASLRENPEIINEDLCPWAKLYKRSLIEENKIRFVENLKYEDAPFVIETLVKANKIGKIDEALNYYVIHGNSETTVRDRRCFDILKIIDKMRKTTKDIPEVQEKMNKLTVRMITNYTVQQRVQKDKKVGMEFIDEAFAYLKKEVPDYRKNKYYEGRGFLRRTVEKNKWVTKLYCKLYK